jgi:glycerol-3-phosphate dehydrogenase
MSVIRARAWGTTLASLLAARTTVRLLAREPEVVASVNRLRQNLADGVGVDMPISATVDALLRGDVSPQDVVSMMMNRSPKPELLGLAHTVVGDGFHGVFGSTCEAVDDPGAI